MAAVKVFWLGKPVIFSAIGVEELKILIRKGSDQFGVPGDISDATRFRIVLWEEPGNGILDDSLLLRDLERHASSRLMMVMRIFEKRDDLWFEIDRDWNPSSRGLQIDPTKVFKFSANTTNDDDASPNAVKRA